MYICKEAFKQVRPNSNEIFKSNGLYHLQNVEMFYHHPNAKGHTTICQVIGEAIVLLVENLKQMKRRYEYEAEYMYSLDRDTIYIDIKLPREWRDASIVDNRIGEYRAVLNGNQIRYSVYDKIGRPMNGNPENIRFLYQLLPVVMAMIANQMEHDAAFKEKVLKLTEYPTQQGLIEVHEDFYQANKDLDFEISYERIQYRAGEGLISYKDECKAIEDKKKQDKIDALMSEYRGEEKTFEKESFKDEYQELIPALGEEFIVPDKIRQLKNAVVTGDIRYILFHGPAGTGKTMSCKLLAREIGLPIMEVINCTENLDEFVLGKYIPKDDRIIFQESYVTKAIREGGAVVFEEINFAKPQYLAFLNSLLDDNGFVRLDNGEVVKRHPNFRFFATMNINYFGTKELNQALYNRFNCVVSIDELSDEAIKNMLIARVPECKGWVEDVISFYHQLKGKIEREELDIVLSPRNLENWMRLARYVSIADAAENTIVPIAKGDKDMETDIRLLLKQYHWR